MGGRRLTDGRVVPGAQRGPSWEPCGAAGSWSSAHLVVIFDRAARLLRAPVFIIGCPRSGTTFVGELFGSHPAVAYWNEPPAIMAYCPRVFLGAVPETEAARFYRTAYRRWLRRRSLRGVRRFVEKCPRHVFVVPFLARIFPGARFVHVVRDGRAVASSLVRTGWLGGESTSGDGTRARYWVPADRRHTFETTSDVGRASMAWDLYVRAGLLGRHLGPERYTEIRYEDLLSDTVSATTRLLAFVGLPMDEAVQRFLDGVRRERTAAWRTELGEGSRREVETMAAELLAGLGYVTANTS